MDHWKRLNFYVKTAETIFFYCCESSKEKDLPAPNNLESYTHLEKVLLALAAFLVSSLSGLDKNILKNNEALLINRLTVSIVIYCNNRIKKMLSSKGEVYKRIVYLNLQANAIFVIRIEWPLIFLFKKKTHYALPVT